MEYKYKYTKVTVFQLKRNKNFPLLELTLLYFFSIFKQFNAFQLIICELKLRINIA